MFGRKKEKPHLAAVHTNTPLNDHMTLLMAQELPLVDSKGRARIYQILREYDGPIITSQDELPEEIRAIMDL